MRFVHALALIALARAGAIGADPADRMPRLIRQLGDDRYARREAASRELDAIGEPARAALTRAAADPDPEVGRRARQLLDRLAVRAMAAAAQKELDRWQGEWTGNGGQKFVVRGDRWAWGQGGSWTLDESHQNRVLIVAVGEKIVQADLVVADPVNGPQVCHAIFRLDGDTLHYCGTYQAFRPTEFRTTGIQFHVPWTRVKKK
jgi:hypothetical protein